MSDNYQASGNFNTSINEEKQKSNGEPKAEQETTTGTAKPTSSRSASSWVSVTLQKFIVSFIAGYNRATAAGAAHNARSPINDLRSFGRRIINYIWWVVFWGTFTTVGLIGIVVGIALFPIIAVFHIGARVVDKLR